MGTAHSSVGQSCIPLLGKAFVCRAKLYKFVGQRIRLLGKAVCVCRAKHSPVGQSCIRLLGKVFVCWAKLYSSVGQSIRLLGKAFVCWAKLYLSSRMVGAQITVQVEGCKVGESMGGGIYVVNPRS